MSQHDGPQVAPPPIDPIPPVAAGPLGATAPGPRTHDAGPDGAAKRALKGGGVAAGMALVIIPAALCRIEARLSQRGELFIFFGQALALVPGLPGVLLRRCFYHLTLRSCHLSCTIGFLSYINDSRSEVGRRVYVGSGACLGLVSLGDGCLIGTKSSIINGGNQHQFGPDGRLTPFNRAMARCVHVGEETWIGEAAVLMADIGSRCIVSAGAVVSTPVPDGCMVGGNPARFVRKVL